MLIYVLIGLLVCALFGHQVAEQKQDGNRGFWLGLFMGPAGVIAAGFMDGRPQCHRCGGRLNDTATRTFDICPNCRADLAVMGSQRRDEINKSERRSGGGKFGSFSQLLQAE